MGLRHAIAAAAAQAGVSCQVISGWPSVGSEKLAAKTLTPATLDIVLFKDLT